jgi:titin
VVEGNYLGPSAQGTRANQITDIGVGVYSPYNRIGGTTPAARNVIGQTGYGIEMSAPFSHSNVVQGNFIGTDATGTQIMETIPYGILMLGSDGNQIGGAEPGAGNVISGSYDYGIWLTGVGNVIQGNFIGTDVTGTKALPNATGLFLQQARTNLVGGLSAGEGNLISGNLDLGVKCGADAEENLIAGNRIGTDVTGLLALGNSHDGVWPGRKNAFLGNSIFGNGGLGINTWSYLFDGVTGNDAADIDGVQNFPILDGATNAAGVTTIVGRMQSRPNESFTLEFFSSIQPDPSGYGEGQFPLGTLIVATDANGMGTFVFVVAADTVGQYATATARSAAGNTSEFSRARLIVP